jgi:DedD protein
VIKGWSRFMDRRVKERLVGATILVVLIVLIVPELLSGPKRAKAPVPPAESAEPVRNVTVDLATSKATPEPEQPIPAAAAPSETAAPAPADADAVPPVGPPAPAASAGPRIVTLQAQHPTPLPLENGAATPKSDAARGRNVSDAKADGGHTHWAVQVGSFASQTNAERFSRQLQAEGFATYVMAGGAGHGSALYRVRVGPLPDRASAARTISRLGKVGRSASLVSP